MHSIDVIVTDESTWKYKPDTGRLEAYAARVLNSENIDTSDVNIVMVDDARMTELNEQYKKRTGTTDVLSFALSDPDDPTLIGEVYISIARAIEQAFEFDVQPEEELVRLATHGLLHLAGRIHDTDDRYREMIEDTEALVREYIEEKERT